MQIYFLQPFLIILKAGVPLILSGTVYMFALYFIFCYLIWVTSENASI